MSLKELFLHMTVDIPAFRCCLSNAVMRDPVIILSTNTELTSGLSYERTALERWLAERGDHSTRYCPNTALKAMLDAIHAAGLHADLI